MWGPMGNPPNANIRRNSMHNRSTAHVPTHTYQTVVPDERNSFDNGMPYTFDPLFVEDPLSA